MRKRTRCDIALYGTWKCIWCNKIFRTKAKLIEHKHLVHTKYDKDGNKISWNYGKNLMKEKIQKFLDWYKQV